MKVVFHIDESHKWGMVLANARNIQRYSSANAEELVSEIVANGEAVKELRGRSEFPDLHDQMQALMEEGVLIAACGNAMQGQRMTEEDLLAGVVMVPAGVVELVQKQHEGFAYIKP